AADDDPSGIATYSQAGAKFGFHTLWTLAFTYPLMVAIQIVSARIGRVSGHGLATHIRHQYSRRVLHSIIFLLVTANTINIGADIAAMGDACTLLIGGDGSRYFALGFGLASLLLQIFIPYKRYVRILKWLTFALFAYIATAFVEAIPWRTVLHDFVLPRWSWQREYVTTLVAIFGTTISPYLFFWQSSQEVEELRRHRQKPLRDAPAHTALEAQSFQSINVDTVVGMGVSNIVAFFIMLSAAVTLHAHGVSDIQTSADAAAALRPLAGDAAFWLFTLGIIGTGLLSVPVLAGSAAYAVGGAFNWNSSLEHSFSEARPFYAVVAAATLIGTALCFSPINPMRALYWSAVINGVIAVPIMAIMMRMAVNARVMGEHRIGPWLHGLGWLATAVMALAVVAMAYFSL
ncbi:MAG TPA: divalent metal cation transporter, partial [Spongiibacteraceae bacterium]